VDQLLQFSADNFVRGVGASKVENSGCTARESSSGSIREFPFSNRLLGLHFDPKFSFGPPGRIGLRSNIKLLVVPIDLSAKKILVD
jgi:hypothetical protein